MSKLLIAFQRSIETFTSHCAQSSPCDSLSPEEFKNLVQKELADLAKGSNHPEIIEVILQSTQCDKPVDFKEFLGILKNAAAAYYESVKSKEGESLCGAPKENSETTEQGSQSAMAKLLAAVQGSIETFTIYSSQSSPKDTLSPEEFQNLIQNEFVESVKDPNHPKAKEMLLQYKNTKNQKPMEFVEFLDFLKNIAGAYYDDMKSSKPQGPNQDPTQSQNQPTNQDPTQIQNQPTNQDPTQSQNQPTNQDPTQIQNQPTNQDPTQNQNQPTNQDTTQNQNQPTNQDPTQNQNQPTNQDPTQKQGQPTKGDPIKKNN
ncbi:hypothetical protein XENTR_v10022822 [Xenopus tropicalis]|uniref:S100/CaBP-9k-type calcium binding subdomain domain-containing protein n=2 Tax=Xenopus tropicalis TaxID=8364 RepID=A0A8J1IQX1_XENTR|nr:putative uncharacterized protein DDB_G0279653 [Xenopus tropicalis]KAE8588934.1 hypothetical protein XENTR_v10022822 [Xenopus tropicalis]